LILKNKIKDQQVKVTEVCFYVHYIYTATTRGQYLALSNARQFCYLFVCLFQEHEHY